MQHKGYNEPQRAQRNFRLCVRYVFFVFIVSPHFSIAQSVIDSFFIHGDIKVTIDRPFLIRKNTNVVFYALPNGNSTEQTMGKRMVKGDDWHFDIQHIHAQTRFIRSEIGNAGIVLIYLENTYKSWPAWKQKHPEYKKLIPHLVDSLTSIIPASEKDVYLNGHSGGGSFIFGYLAGIDVIPAHIRRISFIDSNYGYDSSYYPKLAVWLQNNKYAALNVFAYNDSIALLNGKPIVSATGGTWYRSHLMLKHLSKDFSFERNESDSLIIYKSRNKRVQFFFKKNLNRGIYHTQQVELNGFIHSVLAGTKYDSKGYKYYEKRAYEKFIQ